MTIVVDYCRFVQGRYKKMGYEHKRKACTEEAEESLENVLKIERAEYALIEAAETVLIPNPMQEVLGKEATTNVLPDEANELLREESEEKVEVASATATETDTIEEYETSVNVEFKIDREKDRYHKNRKAKNILKLGYEYQD
ncbi:hypothetical protein EU546_02725 [Candidatus Thorarchaeota archaeon]|nr:MAG: hypothetical protein EU546_02725 [Candidatus Thorarchaeota archaeon]